MRSDSPTTRRKVYTRYDCNRHLIVRLHFWNLGDYGVSFISITPRFTLTRIYLSPSIYLCQSFPIYLSISISFLEPISFTVTTRDEKELFNHVLMITIFRQLKLYKCVHFFFTQIGILNIEQVVGPPGQQLMTDFELQSQYYVQFQTNAFGKGMNP